MSIIGKCKSVIKVADQFVKDFDKRIIENIVYKDMNFPTKDSVKMKR